MLTEPLQNGPVSHHIVSLAFSYRSVFCIFARLVSSREGTPDEHPERRLRLTGSCEEGEGERQGIDKPAEGRIGHLDILVAILYGDNRNGMFLVRKFRSSDSSDLRTYRGERYRD